MADGDGPIRHVPPPWVLKGTSYIFMFWISSAEARSLPKGIAFSPLEAQSPYVSSAPSGSPKGGLATIQVHRYTSSPVGPYDEFILSTGMHTYSVEENGRRKEKSNMRITRIYVSQKTSCWNGRKDWGTPKHLARFEFNEKSDGAMEIKVFPHDTTSDPREATPDNEAFFRAVYKPVPFLPSVPLSTSLVKYLGIDFTIVQPPVPEGNGSQGELPGSDKWCKFYPTISSSQTAVGWFDLSQEKTSEKNFWPGIGRWRLGIRMENANISFSNVEHWETPHLSE
ncbi:hypothetical protein CCHL11_03876 [Colletotrichum chlorophyti]|uniref:Uncharacterized protein n=1 Tax=Colletotrichum chlorophyti TaxID=708187 RepID=A0A1Q8RQS3_9PEZI|nr:hypothetical protein CCHL11_03876 [Colletotrichum chlorophyti]